MAIDIEYIDCASDTHKTYNIFFFDDTIQTLITDNPDTVTKWISDTEFIHRRRLHRLIIGLDVEWQPWFSRRYRNPVAILQLCVGRRCLIYQLIHSGGVPGSLVEFLSKPNYTFVGVNINGDLNLLEKDYGFGRDANAVDLRNLAAEEYNRSQLKNAGLKELARVVLEKDVPKERRVKMSRWDNPRLTEDQVLYATVDAFVSFEIGRVLNASG